MWKDTSLTNWKFGWFEIDKFPFKILHYIFILTLLAHSFACLLNIISLRILSWLAFFIQQTLILDKKWIGSFHKISFLIKYKQEKLFKGFLGQSH